MKKFFEKVLSEHNIKTVIKSKCENVLECSEIKELKKIITKYYKSVLKLWKQNMSRCKKLEKS